ncbi:unnamed protein product [Musa acuminata subsp. malaccensis]|uniref:(wild Malaysian banana) hypothetical protein n=1 Tax=Musa acuminata subsp. malaccensis TaxID=214687 RepID=A0A804KIP6_MUSAM|nr:unnamed protein product [Musa acuminata subsp. malaccensis]
MQCKNQGISSIRLRWVSALFRVVITCAAFICRERQQPSHFSPSTRCSVLLLSQPRGEGVGV